MALDQEQYDAEYEAEMARLNGEAAPATTPPENEPEAEPLVIEEPSAAEDPPAPVETDAERLAKLEVKFASTEKALNDTKAWAARNAAENKSLRQAQEERDRLANRPQVLDDNPGLDDAIRYVTGAPAQTKAPEANPQAAWGEAVATALPKLDALLGSDPAFRAKAHAKAQELGDDWTNPLIAIRELSELQTEHHAQAVTTRAREQAAKDFQLKGKKQTAMQVPGGGSVRAPAKVDEAKAIEDMSDAEFQKMRAKTLGY